ncbi:bifunctional lysylphosphatidylglycerol flippase/synthetase MprF [Amycolatopsis anabasis]|uniref:bifunctional lysylphosphatidylglycerol flippase/synthetase MprF n=1 Tax=Amycolatopsis anabasis TaxID=1840409 RepID=UPI00131B7932|nr:DUF2156 domain-containing protein [Amycolatopsis anabasis]
MTVEELQRTRVDEADHAPRIAAPAPVAVRPKRPSRVGVLIRRLPFTSAVTIAMLALSICTGTLWDPARERSWYPFVAYGVPTLEDGHWWTVAAGAFFAVVPLFYLPMAGGFALLVGFTEWRLGTGRTAAITIGGQLVGVLGACLILMTFRHSGWEWAERLSHAVDAGFSGGSLAAITVASAAIRSPWRWRIRAAVCTYAGVAILYVGNLADLVHFVAVAAALPLAGVLVGRHRVRRTGTPSRRERRLLAVVGLVVVASAQVVMWLIPGDGPLGSSRDLSASLIEVIILVAAVVVIGNGLRRGSRVAWRWAVGLTVFALLQGVVVVAVLALGDLAGEDNSIEGVPLLVADSLPWAAELCVLIVARGAFRTPPHRYRLRHARGTTAPETARTLVERWGGGSLSWMTTWSDNFHFITPDRQSYLAHRRHAGVAIALGDPIGPPGHAEHTVRGFAEMCDQAGLMPCLFSASTATRAIADELGWQHVQVAEDTLIDLETFELRGKRWQDVRSALNRARKEGIEFRLVTLAEQPRSILTQVREISEEWIGDKGMPEMGFTLGGVDDALDPDTRVGLAIDQGGTVHGFTSWLPIHTGEGTTTGWTLDLMRRRATGFRPVIEFLIASACLAFQAEGARTVSLSGSPLACTRDREKAPAIAALLETLGAKLEPYYGFRSLHAFKTKFQPRYQPLYLCYRDEADLPRIGIALGRAYLPDTRLRDLVRCLRKSGAHMPG